MKYKSCESSRGYVFSCPSDRVISKEEIEYIQSNIKGRMFRYCNVCDGIELNNNARKVLSKVATF